MLNLELFVCVRRYCTNVFRCNIVEVESRDTFSCPPGTIINAIGKSTTTGKICGI